MKKISIIILTLFVGLCFAQNPQQAYLPKTVIFKIKPEYRTDLTTLKQWLCFTDKEQISRKFPSAQPPIQLTNPSNSGKGHKFVDLSLIYELKYQKDIPVEDMAKDLLRFNFIDYAQPYYLPLPLYTPNDPLIFIYQQYLSVIKAYEAWDITKGDTNVVIGILDVGFYLNHQDLINNIKYNYADPIDGYDNDSDGFTDNYRGWDLADNDNNPQIDNNDNHGTAVAGVASASTNNGNHIAGVGFKCKFLPVKVANSEGILTHAYEGIVYAADHGCSVILCPWGSEISNGQFGQDIINYAVINKDAVVIASAGNDSLEIAYYPASYEYVLSVAATDNSDIKWEGSNYGCSVDICAPGKNITSLKNAVTGIYTSSGTSLSAAIVAGGAALLRSRFLSYNALQIAEQLKTTADKIDVLNPAYAGKLGSGRLNLHRSLTDTTLPSIVISNLHITDYNDNLFNAGETIFIWATITNYLHPTDNLQIRVLEDSPYISLYADSIVSFGILGTLQTDSISYYQHQTVLKISPNIPSCQNETVCLKFLIYNLNGSDTTYFTTQCFCTDLILQMGFLNIDTNKIGTTIVSDGRIGYYSYPSEGLGFTFEGAQSILKEAGLMIGISSSKVVDNIQDTDFVCIQPVGKIIPPIESDFDVTGIFNDDSAGAEKLNLSITQFAFAWTDSAYDEFVIFEYHILNTGTTTLNNLFAGMFADWDIGELSNDAALYDDINRLGYIFSYDGDGYAGIKLLNVFNPSLVNYYAIEGVPIAGSINITDGFSTQEKFTTLSTDRPAAGYDGYGNNVRHVLSTGPYTLSPLDTLVVVFAFTAGDHLLELQQNAVSAQSAYNQISITENFLTDEQFQIYPNPATTEITIKMENGKWKMENVELKIYDLLGKEVKVQSSKFKVQCYEQGTGNWEQGTFVIHRGNLVSGVYFCKVIVNNKVFVGKIVIL